MAGQGTISGIGQRISSFFKGSDKVVRDKLAKASVPMPDYPINKPIEERIKWLIDKFDWESSYEMLLLFRKWFRNHLIYCNYHEVNPVGDAGVGWDATAINAPEYTLPSNYYRSFIRYGASLYVQTAPEFIAQPTSDDPESQAVAESARATLEVEKENIGYDGIRAMEAINLRLYGNSFRYSYYSVDPRYGFAAIPVYSDVEVQLDSGHWICPVCGLSGEGQMAVCPNDGPDAPQPIQNIPPQTAKVPKQQGKTVFPKGQECCEVVWPFEIRTRSSSPDLWHSPYLERKRMVDKIGLMSNYPRAKWGGEKGSETYGSDTTVNATEDIGLMYSQQIPDLPNDPTQYGAWYERTVAPSKVCFQQMWIRPSQYFFDKELREQFPDGMYGAKAEDILLDTKNESIDDHWVHFKHIHVPGRLWGDGDDDLIPEQLKWDEVDRLIMRHVDYNSMPLLLADTQRIDKNNVINDAGYMIEVKNSANRPIDQSAKWLPPGVLSSDVYNWRSSIQAAMQFHSGVSPSAVGFHQPGVNTSGGQEDLAGRSNVMQVLPGLNYKENNEVWAVQMLRIAAENWLDERVQTTLGINGQWQFKKLRGELLQLSKLRIVANIIPLDFKQQQAFSQAVAAQVLNPQDPAVRRKALELFQLPVDLDNFTPDAKVQWKETEKMKQGQQIQPVAFRDNDQAHITALREYMNSDAADSDPPQIQQIMYQHLMSHLENMATVQAVQQSIAAGGQPPQPQGAPGQAQHGQQPKAPDKNQNPQFRHQRAQQGQAAKPKLPQPPGGNQNHVGRPGMSESAVQRRNKV